MVESASKSRSQSSRVTQWPASIALVGLICTIAFVLVAGAVVARAPSARIMPNRAASQEQPARAHADAQGPAIRSESDVVHLDVLVTDQDGRVLRALKKENFRVLDNGQPQVVTNFAPTSAPLTMVILMEYSGTAYSYFAYKAANWGSMFVNYLEPRDWIALVTYDLKPSIRVDFTRNKASIRDALATLSFPQFRETNLFDSLLDTLDRLEEVKGKKSLLLIGTGANTFSSNTLGAVIDRIQRTDVTIFGVGLAESEYLRTHRGNITYLQAKNQLDTFADETGGITYFPRFEGELPDIFRSIAGFLRSQYSIGFAPSNLAADGRYHKLKVEIVGPDGKPLQVTNEKGKRRKLVVYARRGYFAPSEPHP